MIICYILELLETINNMFTLFLIVLAAFLYLSYRHLMTRRFYSRPTLPPGYMGLPVVGEMFPFALEAPTGEFFTKREDRYGSVYKTHILFKPTVYISSPLTVKQVTLGEHSLVENAWPQSMQILLGAGSLAASSARDHKQRKQRVVRCFKRERIAGYLPLMHRIIVAEMKSWTEQGPVQMYVSAQRMTLRAAARIMLGVEQLGDIESDIVEYAGGFFTLPVNLPGTAYYKATKAKERLRQALESMLKSRGKSSSNQASSTKTSSSNDKLKNLSGEDHNKQDENNPDKQNSSSDESKHDSSDDDMMTSHNDVITSLYSHFLGSGDKKSKGEVKRSTEVSDSVYEHVINQSLELLFGGQGTLSGLIVCIIMELEKNPEVVDKMREEMIQNGIPIEPDCEMPSLEQVDKLEYLWNVSREALRMYPPVGGGYRRALKTFHTTEGYEIPKDWTITYSIKAVHDNSKLYTDKHIFRPERWYDIQQDEVSHFDFMPFGAGARACVGKEYAKLFIRLFLINLVRAVTWQKEDRSGVVILKVPILKPQPDISVSFRMRESNQKNETHIETST